MLKYRKISFILLSLLFVLCSCGSEPKLGNDDEDDDNGIKTGLVSIAYLKSLHNLSPVTIKNEMRIEGRVVSSDRSGNFHKTICVEDETGGIAVRLNGTELFKKYKIGAKIRVDCNTLTLGTYGGLPQLGVASGDGKYQTDPIPSNIASSHVYIIGEAVEEPLPAVLRINQLEPKHISCYIEIRGVQFKDFEEGMTWCEPDDDTDRILVDKDGSELIVRTSRYTDYADSELPAGSGLIRGVMSYFNGKYQLIINSRYEAVLDNERF